MLDRFCMTQKLKCLLVPREMPPEVEELLEEWEAMETKDIRGTLLSDSFSYNESFQMLEEVVTWSDHELSILPPPWYHLLKQWVLDNDITTDSNRLSASAFMRKHIKRLGETFRIEETSSLDAHIYYQGPNNSLCAGTILGIFTHTRASYEDSAGDKKTKTETFFIVKQYKPLPPTYQKYDPYARFSAVAGSLYRDANFEGDLLINGNQLLYHFALGRINIPQIPFSCIVALPMSRT